MNFSLPQETNRKPATESSQNKTTTTSSSIRSDVSLPDKLKPIPVESVILFKKQQKKKSFVQKVFSCFYAEEEKEQEKKPVKRESPKPIQQVILPGTGQPPKGVAPWERSGKKPQRSPSASQGSKQATTTENESTKSGNSNKSGGSSAAPWQSGLRKKNRRVDESYSSFSIPDELLKHRNAPLNGKTGAEVKKSTGEEVNVTFQGATTMATAPHNTRNSDTTMSTSNTKTAEINSETSGKNNNSVAPPPPPPPANKNTATLGVTQFAPPPPSSSSSYSHSGAKQAVANTSPQPDGLADKQNVNSAATTTTTTLPPPPPPPLPKSGALQSGTKAASPAPPPPPPPPTKRT
jgi:hypothetical protein